MKFIEKRIGRDVSYIGEVAVKAVELQGNNTKLVYVGGSSEDCKPEIVSDDFLSNFLRCASYGLNRMYIVYADVAVDSTSVSYCVEGGNIYKFEDSGSVANASNAVDNALFVSRGDGSKVYINPDYIDKIESPFATTKVFISEGDGRKMVETDAQIEGNPSLVAIVKLFNGAPLRFSGVEARQVFDQTITKPVTK